jgi:hypothetical protein
MNPELQTAIYTTVGGILLGGIIKLGALTKKWMESQITSLETRISIQTRDELRYALQGEAARAAQVVERTFVKKMRAAGTWNEETQVEALQRATQIALSMLTEEQVKRAKEEFGDVETILQLYIEASSAE